MPCPGINVLQQGTGQQPICELAQEPSERCVSSANAPSLLTPVYASLFTGTARSNGLGTALLGEPYREETSSSSMRGDFLGRPKNQVFPSYAG